MPVALMQQALPAINKIAFMELVKNVLNQKLRFRRGFCAPFDCTAFVAFSDLNFALSQHKHFHSVFPSFVCVVT